MKRICLLLLTVFLSVSVTKAQTPLQFNNKLAGITDSLFSKGQKWGVTFNEAFKNASYSTLKNASGDLLVYIDTNIIYVEDMKDVKNSKPLRMAMLELLAFEKQMVMEGFLPFESFDAATPKEKVQTALNRLTAKAKEEDTYLKKVEAAQEVYAAENGFKIETQKAADNN